MERYRTRNGVVLTSICGEYLLVAAQEARKFCPFCTQISESSAFLWRLLENGAEADQLLKAVEEEYEIDDRSSTLQAIDQFVAQMLELGYLLREGDKHA